MQLNTEYIEKDIDGQIFRLYKFHAVSGREIVSQYVSSGVPKVGNYKTNEEMMLKLMSYVCVISQGNPVRLQTVEYINSHIKSFETLLKVEMAMMEYNVSFFQNGQISSIFKDLAQNLQQWITKTLTASLAPLSQTEKPPSTN